MLMAAVGVAAFAYWLEWWSAVFAYPIDSGGRPLHSWPVFLLVPWLNRQMAQDKAEPS